MERKLPQLNSFKTIDRVTIDLNNDSETLHKPQDIRKPQIVNKIKPSLPIVKEQKLNYDNILSSMGIQMINGKLELFNKELQQRQWNPYTVAPHQTVNKGNIQGIRQANRQGIIQANRQNLIQKNFVKPIVPHKQDGNQEENDVGNQEENDIGDGHVENKNYITPQQLKIIRLLKYLRHVREIQRLNQVKSRKLLFNNPNVNISISRSNAESNKLFRFVGVAH